MNAVPAAAAGSGSTSGRRWLHVARLACPTVAGVGIVLNLLALPAFTRLAMGQAIRDALPTWHLSVPGFDAIMIAMTVVPMMVNVVVAAVVFLRASSEPMALFCVYTLVLFGCGVVGPLPWVTFSDSMTVLGTPALTRLAGLLTPLGLFVLGVFVLVFPSGTFVPRWLRWPATAGGTALLVGSLLLFTRFEPLASAIVQTTGSALLVVGAAAQIYRYRRISTPTQRQQTKWVLFGLAGCVTVLVSTRLMKLAVPRGFRDSVLAQTLLGGGTVALALAIVPVGIGIAILRARLWDIDLIINRALLYGALTASVIIIYVVVVAYLGRMLRTDATQWMSLVATGVVAVVLQPLRGRLQRGVNRLTYGQRDEPYAVVAQLGRRLESSIRTESVLPTAVETLARALKLPYAAITLDTGDDPASGVVEYGEPVPDPLVLPLTYHSEPAGRLLLGPRRPGESFTPADLRLLRDLAPQVGAAAHAVSLATDLQRSRERLVTAREEERRRLRRDLHDGLGPTLAGLALKASAISDLVSADPAGAACVADELYAEIRGTITEIRRLVYELRPPTLDELGLVGAIQELARQQTRAGQLTIDVRVKGDLDTLPAAVEVAAYRIVGEALTNVQRHANARTCAIHLSRTDRLCLDIIDDGIGMPPGRPAGVGLVAIRERSVELGGTFLIDGGPQGGTRLTIRLPLPDQLRQPPPPEQGEHR
jgi:signal transduction histidine kinase